MYIYNIYNIYIYIYMYIYIYIIYVCSFAFHEILTANLTESQSSLFGKGRPF